MNNKLRAKILFNLLAASLIVAIFVFPLLRSRAQTGVLTPVWNISKPEGEVLSLERMDVDICVDNQFATVKVMQIFDNHTASTLEGKYLFGLPQNATVSDFAIWESDARIPGVMLERRRAESVYGEIKQAQVDPGILQQADDNGGDSAFSVKVFPINPYATKRIEIAYTEMLSVESLRSHFTFPLKPSDGAVQKVGEFNLHLCVYNDFPITPFLENTGFPLKITKNEPNELEAEFSAENIELSSDFAFDYQINAPSSALSFIAYRAPEKITAYDLRDPSQAAQNPDGFFASTAIFNQHNGNFAADRQPRRVILLLDTSLSMYGEKLQRAVEAVDYFLHNLAPEDEFNLVLFGNDAVQFSDRALPATPETVENALSFVRNSTLGGGTNLKKAFEKALELEPQFSLGERSIVLVSDANPTLETKNLKTIEQVFENRRGENALKFFAFGLGGDANENLLKELAEKTNGYFDSARETEDIAAALEIFLAKVGQPTIENLGFRTSDDANFYQVYSTSANSYDGSSAGFVGRYKQPTDAVEINVAGKYGAGEINLSRTVALPDFSERHAHLPRFWARARVDALLREINLNGEREDYISEIIRLSQKYKFVTPYTAFLAAPRALLRPRLIQPGDPVIRVKTDPAVTSVFAVLPFGETLPLKFLEKQGVWETRFLAPAWMPDGTYSCRLLLTDKNGNGYEEKKTFVVDSHAPKLKIELPQKTFRAGEEILLKVAADSDTFRLTAKLYGATPVALAWSAKDKANVGRLRVPETLSGGQYVVTVAAEDFAHNQSTAETQIQVLSR